LLDLPLGASFGWSNIVEIAGLDSLFQKNYPQADEQAIMRFLIEDADNPSSILSCVQFARENTRTLREVLPAEMWERINSLFLYVRENAAIACRSRRDRYMVLNNIIEQRHAIVGLIAGTMAHDLAYQIIRLGRNIERADMTTRILDLNSAIQFPKDSVAQEALLERIWMSTLNSLSAYQTYRRLISMHVRRGDVIKFLIHDLRFPRSVDYCLGEIESCLKLMPRSGQLQKITAHLRLELSQRSTENLDTVGLHQYLDQLQIDFAVVQNALSQNYFHAYDHDENPDAKSKAESTH
jgi:uncharacterized alpha-E superfamily protein